MSRSLLKRTFLVLLSVTLLAAASLFVFFVSFRVELHADQPLQPKVEELAKRLIAERKCGNCHTLQARGLELSGKVGPELTHQARRERSTQWLRHQLTDSSPILDHRAAPGMEGRNRLMPKFDNLSRRELAALIQFLTSLD